MNFVSLWIEGEAEGNEKPSNEGGSCDQGARATSECLSRWPSTTKPGQELLSCQHLAATIQPREDHSCCFPRRQCDPQRRASQVAGQEKEARKLRVMEIGSMPRRYGTPDRPDRWVTTLEGADRAAKVQMRGQQRFCTYLGTLEYEQGQDLTLQKELMLDTAR